MEARRWINQSQPQTLVIATFLFYIHAVFTGLDMLQIGLGNVLGAGIPGIIYFATVPGGVLAGYGIANEKRNAYYLGIGVALFPFAWRLYYGGLGNILNTGALTLMFEIALVALLLHTQSRDYQRVWFR